MFHSPSNPENLHHSHLPSLILGAWPLHQHTPSLDILGSMTSPGSWAAEGHSAAPFAALGTWPRQQPQPSQLQPRERTARHRYQEQAHSTPFISLQREGTH